MYGDFLALRTRLASADALEVPPFAWHGADAGKCWQNVRTLVASLGGKFSYGWALGSAGPTVRATPQRMPLYYRWVNHVVWCDSNGQLWEVTPIRDEIDGNISWRPTDFVVDDQATFEFVSDEVCCPQPAIYVAVKPEGEWTADCLCHVERAAREVQEDWLERALYSIRQAGLEPESWRVKRVGDILRDVWIFARPFRERT